VVADPGNPGADTSIRNQLAALNPAAPGNLSRVLMVDDSASQTGDATGKDLVVISASTSAGNVGNKFQSVQVPVMVMQYGILDDMGMIGNANQAGLQTGQTALTITGSGHPLTAGLGNGDYNVYTSSNSLVYGRASSGAVEIAGLTGGNPNNRDVIYAFAQNASMPALPWTAPARRVAFFLYSGIAFTSMTSQGQVLFNASVCWAMTGSACPS